MKIHDLRIIILFHSFLCLPSNPLDEMQDLAPIPVIDAICLPERGETTEDGSEAKSRIYHSTIELITGHKGFYAEISNRYTYVVRADYYTFV